jgi:hypothetical protein
MALADSFTLRIGWKAVLSFWFAGTAEAGAKTPLSLTSHFTQVYAGFERPCTELVLFSRERRLGGPESAISGCYTAL